MFKSKTKLFILFFLMFTLITSYCFASEPTTTSLLPGDNAKTVTEETDTISEETTDETSSEEPEILYDDLYLFDTTVTMDKLVDGNVYICAQTANITGQVNGNLYVIAENVNIDGAYIGNSIFICSTTTTFNAACNDLYFIGTNLDVSYDSYIARDSRIGGNNITFKGLNYRNMYIDANTINFGEGDSVAAIQGNLNYSSPNELTLADGMVSGEVTYNLTEINEDTNSSNISSIIYSVTSALIYSLIAYFAFKFFTPKFVENISNFSKVNKFFISGLVGLIGLVIIPIVAVILLLSIYGLGASVALFVIYGLMISIAFTIFSLFITKLIQTKFNKLPEVCLFMIVVFILSLSKYIPYLGYILGYIYGIFGFGMIIMSLAKKNIIPKKEETTAKEENK